MINFDQFKKFDRVKTLDPFEQQRQYWIFRNDVLNPLSYKSAVSTGGGGTRRLRREKPFSNLPASFNFFTVPNQQFITTTGDILIKTSTGFAKAIYPYDLPVEGIFGTGDPNLSFSILFSDPTFWNGALPFRIFSCDSEGKPTGELTYAQFDLLANVKSIDFTNCKDDLVELDLAGCTDLESITIPSSVSLLNLNISNTIIKELEINGCDSLETLTFQSTIFKSNYFLNLNGIPSLKTINGDNCNLLGLETDSTDLESISLNDCGTLSSLICTNFTGNFGLGIIEIKNCSLGPGALDALYTSLGTANGTVNKLFIFANFGLTADNENIATDKGYTIDINP